VALGFRGVEADVVLRAGDLRVAHSAAEARPGRTLESLYLQPIRDLVQKCGRVLNPSTPFILNVELKERSRAAYDSLLALTDRYNDLLDPRPPASAAALEIILVGWSPRISDMSSSSERRLGRQHKISSRSAALPEEAASVRLITLDYGKTIKWSGRGSRPQHAASWLDQVRRAKQAIPGRIARAYNAPAHSAVYRLLFEGGIDLIGTEDLQATHRVLRQLGQVNSTE
jgi:hypothetical protein